MTAVFIAASLVFLANNLESSVEVDDVIRVSVLVFLASFCALIPTMAFLALTFQHSYDHRFALMTCYLVHAFAAWASVLVLYAVRRRKERRANVDA